MSKAGHYCSGDFNAPPSHGRWYWVPLNFLCLLTLFKSIVIQDCYHHRYLREMWTARIMHLTGQTKHTWFPKQPLEDIDWLFHFFHGPMEGFWGILKREMYYGKKFTSKGDLITAVESYIRYYNTERIRRKMHLMTPAEFHDHFDAAA